MSLSLGWFERPWVGGNLKAALAPTSQLQYLRQHYMCNTSGWGGVEKSTAQGPKIKHSNTMYSERCSDVPCEMQTLKLFSFGLRLMMMLNVSYGSSVPLWMLLVMSCWYWFGSSHTRNVLLSPFSLGFGSGPIPEWRTKSGHYHFFRNYRRSRCTQVPLKERLTWWGLKYSSHRIHEHLQFSDTLTDFFLSRAQRGRWKSIPLASPASVYLVCMRVSAIVHVCAAMWGSSNPLTKMSVAVKICSQPQGQQCEQLGQGFWSRSHIKVIQRWKQTFQIQAVYDWACSIAAYACRNCHTLHMLFFYKPMKRYMEKVRWVNGKTF